MKLRGGCCCSGGGHGGGGGRGGGDGVVRLVSRECACARFPLGGNLSAAPPCRDLTVSLPRSSDFAVAPTSSRDLSGSLLPSSSFSVALPVCACACACGCACGMCGVAGGGGDGPAGEADLDRRSARRALHGLSRPPARPRCRWRRRASVCASASGRSPARDETPTASTTAAAKIAAASCIAILLVAPLSSSRRRFPGGASSCSRDARFRLAPEPPPLRRSETGCETATDAGGCNGVRDVRDGGCCCGSDCGDGATAGEATAGRATAAEARRRLAACVWRGWRRQWRLRA